LKIPLNFWKFNFFISGNWGEKEKKKKKKNPSELVKSYYCIGNSNKRKRQAI
jgi:hypothetical protein